MVSVRRKKCAVHDSEVMGSNTGWVKTQSSLSMRQMIDKNTHLLELIVLFFQHLCVVLLNAFPLLFHNHTYPLELIILFFQLPCVVLLNAFPLLFHNHTYLLELIVFLFELHNMFYLLFLIGVAEQLGIILAEFLHLWLCILAGSQ